MIEIYLSFGADFEAQGSPRRHCVAPVILCMTSALLSANVNTGFTLAAGNFPSSRHRRGLVLWGDIRREGNV